MDWMEAKHRVVVIVAAVIALCGFCFCGAVFGYTQLAPSLLDPTGVEYGEWGVDYTDTVDSYRYIGGDTSGDYYGITVWTDQSSSSRITFYNMPGEDPPIFLFHDYWGADKPGFVIERSPVYAIYPLGLRVRREDRKRVTFNTCLSNEEPIIFAVAPPGVTDP